MSSDDTLYRYCSAESVFTIIRSRSLRLSSLSLSNDTMEGQLVNATIMGLAERDNLDAQDRERLRESLAFLGRFFDGLGFCLSEDGDLLSQWRGYPDDARGVSIGFGQEYLKALASSTGGGSSAGFSLYKVEYDPVRHEALVEPTYRELRKLIDSGAFKIRGAWSIFDSRTPDEIAADDKKIEDAHKGLVFKTLELFPRLYELKSQAFREEREWRLVSIFVCSIPDKCEFRAIRGRVIPFRDFELKQLESTTIKEVVLGPKHETPPSVTQSLLKLAGFGEVSVRRSELTYR